MSRTAVMGTFVFVVAGLSGCAAPARVIRQDPTSVVVAIPDNTNDWPFYYQDEAKQEAGKYLQDPILSNLKRTKVGEQTTNTSDTTRRDVGSPDRQRSFGEVVTSTNTTAVSDRYEYQLEFRSGTPVRNGIAVTGGSTPPVTPAASLSPRGAPEPADAIKPPPALPPILPVTPPTSPATNMPSTTLPAPGR